MVAAFAAYVAMYDGKFYAWESIGFIVMYVVYLIVLIGGHLINRRLKSRNALLQASNTEIAAKNYGSIAIINDLPSAVNESSDAVPTLADPDQDVTYALSLRRAFVPRDESPWAEKSIFNKVVTVLKVRKE